MYCWAYPKDIDVARAEVNVPQEVAGSISLYRASCTRITPQPLCKACIRPRGIGENDLQRLRRDENRLDETYNAAVPIDLSRLRQLVVRIRRENTR